MKCSDFAWDMDLAGEGPSGAAVRKVSLLSGRVASSPGLGRAGVTTLRSCTSLVVDTFFYHAENIDEEVVMKWRRG